MPTLIDDAPVMQKTQDLCRAILESPNMISIRERIDTFMGDEKARSQYDELVSKGQALQEKQQQSVPLSGEEISTFEQSREALFQNPVARGFLDAQEELHQLREGVTKYVNKTLELGRMPSDEDFESCGHGCNCGH
jgi:cell fate (sporulation/competence/biofilm development) regulator YlbF (YheA/YmcA/DUF963 family)